MWALVSNCNVDFCIPQIADEALASCVEERLGVFGLGSCLEDFLMVKNDGAV